MTDERLTAYALNETTGAEHAEIEQYLAANAEARESVAATRALAAQLTASLAAEAGPPVQPRVVRRRLPVRTLAALAASVMVAAGVAAYAMIDRAPRAIAKGGLEPVLEQGSATALRAPATAFETADSPRNFAVTAIPAPVVPSPPLPTILNPQPHLHYYKGATPGEASAPAGNTYEMRFKNATRAIPTRTASETKKSLDRYGEIDGSKDDAITGYDRFPALEENSFIKVEGLAALSTFGVDVDTASYSIMRKFLSQNQMPPPGAVRLEEMVNYFPYRDAPPSGNDPFAVTVEMAACPWQPAHKLVRIGLKAKPIDYANRPASNLVFLIDVSGSMNAPNRLPLVKQSLKLLVDQLNENDRVAMVVYAGASGLVLESTSAATKSKILDALDRLEAGGSTNGASGIQLAYDTAVANFIPGGTNRVILCTDGDWNVGTTSTDELVKLIEAKRKTGVFLSILGYGMGNLRDEMMVNLAGKGNGNYAYIDSIREAKKALVEQLGGTLVTVAKDVKIQVEFNPAKIGAYRLIGYEKRKLAAQDFNDDTKDAGEMGAGHVVTCLYEITPAGTSPAPAKVDELRYQALPAPKPASTEAFVVKLRHKLPASDVSTLREVPIQDISKPYGEASEDFRFAAAVASYAMLLRDSQYKGNATYAAVEELAAAAKTWDVGGYRAEFLELVKKAKAISGKP